ncbi:MAG TPA: hypothetical protein PK817_06810 [Dokdonella sp.]|jgi:uncharacterized membrane protein YkvA (DUF1232 family)|nr:DUF1232 domain-containing protein [Rhodanobacteraceae bacterium]HQX33262.1 hypothetical protein [Dokdonella sp.]
MPNRLDFVPERSVARLDLSAAQSGIFTPGIETIDIQDVQVQRFNDLAQSLNAEMPSLSADQLAGVARRVLRTAAMGGDSPFIRSRLRRAAEMRAMRADTAWRLSEDFQHRIGNLLGYVDDPLGLIPDKTPVIGLLDDALLVDIAMDVLRDELDGYAEFRRFLEAEAIARHLPVVDLGISRDEWQIAREDELRLEKQLRQVRGSVYASSAAERIFRVC